MDTLDKLHERELPKRSDNMREALDTLESNLGDENIQKLVNDLSKDDRFYSILTDKTISNEDVDSALEMWDRLDMTTFADYVKYYNDADVTGCVEATTKMLKNKEEKGLDMFKI